jgi:hypothetical protein
MIEEANKEDGKQLKKLLTVRENYDEILNKCREQNLSLNR